MIFLIVVLCFIYLTSRISTLEARVNKMERGVPVQSAPVSTPTKASSFPNPVQQTQSLPIVPTPTKTQSESNGLEFQFGGKFFTVVGAIAVLLGVGFFLRYAFDQNLITETMRVTLGLLTGVVLVVTGEVLRKKYDTYSQILQGTGIGVFYLTFFSAFALYSLMGQKRQLIVC